MEEVKVKAQEYCNYILKGIEIVKVQGKVDLNTNYVEIQDYLSCFKDFKKWHYGPLTQDKKSNNLRYYKEGNIKLGFVQAQEILKEQGLKLLDISNKEKNPKKTIIVIGPIKKHYAEEDIELSHGFNKLN